MFSLVVSNVLVIPWKHVDLDHARNETSPALKTGRDAERRPGVIQAHTSGGETRTTSRVFSW
jgi:hypothetical protein